jgi:hypothetical protein
MATYSDCFNEFLHSIARKLMGKNERFRIEESNVAESSSQP